MYYNYEYGEYYAGGTYIAAMEGNELYDDVSICLAEYSINLEENQIAIPEKGEFIKYVKDLSRKVVREVEYGPYHSKAMVIELRDNWKEICKPIDEV